MAKIFFYPHAYLRERHLERIRNWAGGDVVNPEIAWGKRGAQVSRKAAMSGGSKFDWKRKLPLLNIKLRPSGAPKNAVVYVWGGIILTRKFILDLDNPWALVGFNISAMPIYKIIIKKILLSKRCLEIRCMSKACRESLKKIFGDKVYKKAKLYYPVDGIESINSPVPVGHNSKIRLLYIGSQFEVKGGRALLLAYKNAKKYAPDLALTIITHLPDGYKSEINQLNDVEVYPPNFSRNEMYKMMRASDILVHPTYMESFGMVILEGIAKGLCVIATDVYAISEMVVHGTNGVLLKPPITKWDGVLPNENFMAGKKYLEDVSKLDLDDFVKKLSDAIVELAHNPALLQKMRQESLRIFSDIKNSNVA